MLRRPDDLAFLELCGLAAAVCPAKALKPPPTAYVIRLPPGTTENERAAMRNLWGRPRSRFEALLP